MSFAETFTGGKIGGLHKAGVYKYLIYSGYSRKVLLPPLPQKILKISILQKTGTKSGTILKIWSLFFVVKYKF